MLGIVQRKDEYKNHKQYGRFYNSTAHKKIEQSISPTPLFSIVGEHQPVLWIRTFFGFFVSDLIITDPDSIPNPDVFDLKICKA